MGLTDRLRRVKRPEWRRRPEVLLCGNVPQPMHGTAPRVILGQKWWDATRQAAYRATDYHCVACGVWKHHARFRQWLEGHELYAVDYVLGRMEYIETVALCHCCHNYIHSGRLEALLEKGQVTQAKYTAIIQHGEAVLDGAGLGRPATYNGFMAPWGQWRLVLFGEEYPPRYTEAQWRKKYGNQ